MARLNVLDLQDALLLGGARYREAMDEIEKAWLKPVMRTTRAMLMQALPEPVKEQLREDLPDVMAEMEVDDGEEV